MGYDRITHIHVGNLLASKEIECSIQGSMIYRISVPKQKAEAAIQLLREDARKRGYWINFGTKEKLGYAKITPKKITCLPATQLMARPDFAADQPLGRWLHSTDLSAKLQVYPFVESLKTYEREYLATRDKTQIGYYIEVELHPKAGNDSKGFRGRYLVWARGERIEGPSGAEWKRSLQ